MVKKMDAHPVKFTLARTHQSRIQMVTTRLVLLLVLAIFGIAVGRSADAKESTEQVGDAQTAQRFSRNLTVQQELSYLLYLPNDYDADRGDGSPLMLFLHGAGERGNDLSKVKAHGPPKMVENGHDFPFVLVSPQCPEGKLWDASTLSGLLDDLIANHNIDVDRIYLTGLSMGGYGTWSLGMSEPERFAAIAPICGGGEVIKVLLPSDATKEAFNRLPVWAFHGAKDQVVPLEESERMIGALKRGARKTQG